MSTSLINLERSLLSRVLGKIALLLCTLLMLSMATGARGQTGGEIIWSVDLPYTPVTAPPSVAPSGDIYIHSDDLYAISPAGEILWTKPLSGSEVIDVAADGTVYAGSFLTIFAYTPAGDLIWSFSEPPGGQGVMAGPTIGPDGNIYAVTDGGGLGALALTPQGQLLWNQPGYVHYGGTGMTRVPVTAERLYFADDVVPGCNELTVGINALDLNGNLLWCDSISGASRAIATPSGDALVHDFGVLYDYNPDGSIDWQFNFPFPDRTLIGPTVANDGTIYIFHDHNNLWSFTPAGVKRWQVDNITDDLSPEMPIASPDGSVVVFGTAYGFGENGELVAVNAANGDVLWRVPITGPSAGSAGPVAFSNDSQTVYAPITELNGVNKLLALRVKDGTGTGQPAVEVAGECPGTVTVNISGITPNASVGLWVGKSSGSTTIGSGACSGTTLDLRRARLFTTRTADTNGNVTVPLRLGANRCGQLFQAIDLTNCATSNVASGP